MNYFLLFIGTWFLSGLLAGLWIITELKIKGFNLDFKKKKGYFLLGVYWGYVAFIIACVDIIKYVRSK